MVSQGENFLVRLSGSSQVDAAMSMNGRALADGRTPRFHRQEVKMAMEEIFSWVSTELKTQERSSNLAKAAPNAWSSRDDNRRPSRHTYAVEAQVDPRTPEKRPDPKPAPPSQPPPPSPRPKAYPGPRGGSSTSQGSPGRVRSPSPHRRGSFDGGWTSVPYRGKGGSRSKGRIWFQKVVRAGKGVVIKVGTLQGALIGGETLQLAVGGGHPPGHGQPTQAIVLGVVRRGILCGNVHSHPSVIVVVGKGMWPRVAPRVTVGRVSAVGGGDIWPGTVPG